MPRLRDNHPFVADDLLERFQNGCRLCRRLRPGSFSGFVDIRVAGYGHNDPGWDWDDGKICEDCAKSFLLRLYAHAEKYPGVFDPFIERLARRDIEPLWYQLVHRRRQLLRDLQREEAARAGKPKKKRRREPMSKRLRFDVLERDGFCCRYCGRKAPDVELHVDHVVPLSRGGETTRDNLVAACQDCNLGKHDRDLEVRAS